LFIHTCIHCLGHFCPVPSALSFSHFSSLRECEAIYYISLMFDFILFYFAYSFLLILFCLLLYELQICLF
jgi:hypothetical protein